MDAQSRGQAQTWSLFAFSSSRLFKVETLFTMNVFCLESVFCHRKSELPTRTGSTSKQGLQGPTDAATASLSRHS